MSKFKKDNKVKLATLENVGEYAPHLKVGDVGTVTEVLMGGVFIVVFENPVPGIRNQFAFEDFELELV